MAFKVIFSEQATRDIDGIIGYIHDDLCNPQAAARFHSMVNEKLGLLREHPYMFPSCRDEKLGAEGYRLVAVGNFLVFYLVDDDEHVVRISRILYGRRDISSALWT